MPLPSSYCPHTSAGVSQQKVISNFINTCNKADDHTGITKMSTKKKHNSFKYNSAVKRVSIGTRMLKTQTGSSVVLIDFLFSI